MDGLQRITAIKEFYEDKYALEGLEIWPELNSKNIHHSQNKYAKVLTEDIFHQLFS